MTHLASVPMETGKLSISRGREHSFEAPDQPAPPRLIRIVPEPEPEPGPAPEAPPQSPDYHCVHDRLTALERLTRLFDQGALSPEEFAAEKAIILRLPAEELVLRRQEAPQLVSPPRGPSLLARMLAWRFLSFACAIGIAFSFAAQPRETMNFLGDAVRMAGF